MIESWLNKIRTWLAESAPGEPVQITDESLWVQFIEELGQGGLKPDYRDLADFLWLERWITVRMQSTQPEVPPSPTPDDKGDQLQVEPKKPGEKTKEEAPGLSLFTAQTISEGSRIPAVRVRLEGASALPEALQINRALRPLSRRTKSSLPQLFDEESTAEASAECGFLAPVFRPEPERWFSIALVIEDTPAMVVWKQTARELFDLLQGHNAFSQVRQFSLKFAERRPQLIESSGAVRSHRHLSHFTARQLVILLSDGASPSWSDGSMAQVLTDWGKNCAVVIAQVLSERLWPRTPLGWPEAEIKTVSPGSVNASLQLTENWWRVWGDQAAPLIPVPVIGLNPNTIERWARMLMQPGAVYRAALFSAPSGEIEIAASPAEPKRQFDSPAARVDNFKALVSLETYRLAIYLSLLPLTLPVMRLVQMSMIANPKQEQLAELLLGGVIERVNPSANSLPEDEVDYDFYQGVREVLEERIYTDEVGELLRVIGEYLGERMTGKSGFTALLPHPSGESFMPPTARPFARFLFPALRRLGLAYLIGETGSGGSEPGELIPTTLFAFETVTFDDRGKVKERRQLHARQFVEVLAPGTTLEMVEIPGGQFTMGSPESEENSYGDERPQHEVILSPFYIGKFTVTQAQWRMVAGLPRIERELNLEPSYFPKKGGRRDELDDKRPVEQVSWDDAQEFCARLSAKTGRAYRLPTEAEWEYACRAGTATPFAFGETITPEFVNYNGSYPYGKAPKGRYREETVPVGSLGVANLFGLYDMHGNVWEWCRDWASDQYYAECKKQGTVTDPQGPEKGTARRLRGGSWGNYGGNCRSACRYDNEPGYRYDVIGFRVVVSARTF